MHLREFFGLSFSDDTIFQTPRSRPTLMISCQCMVNERCEASLTASGRGCMQVLKELGVEDAPMLTVWNKIDACSDAALVSQVASQRTDTCAISAATGEGLDTLRGALEGMLYAQLHHVHCLVPYSQVQAHERAIHAASLLHCKLLEDQQSVGISLCCQRGKKHGSSEERC